MKVFISYSNRNRDLVESLAKDLVPALGTVSTDSYNEVWFDEQLVGGQDWWNTILTQLRDCDIFVFALSSNSVKSDACQRELKYATDLNKRILPIWITEINALDLPELLQARQWINYSKQDKAAFQELITAMHQLPAAQPLPDPLPTPPDMPRSPLTEISHQLAGDKIDRDQQNEIFSRLREFLAQPDQRKDAYQLLMRLKQHPDLRRSVGEDIDDLLHDHPEFTQATTTTQTQAKIMPPVQFPTTPAATQTPVSNPPPPYVAKTVTVTPPSSSGGSRRWFGLNGKTIGLVIGILGGILYPMTTPTCTLDVYGNYMCNGGFDIEYLVGSIIVWVLIGWAVDIIWRRFRKPN